MLRFLTFTVATVATIAVSGRVCGQDVLTGGYDIARTNANLSETILTPATLTPDAFGRLFLLPADGQIFAQPLYRRNVKIAGQTHNVVFVATAHNSVYAYDADTAAPPLWAVNFGPAVPSSAYDTPGGPYTDIMPEIGILGTPVIDPSTGTLYVVAATVENGAYFHRLHALDIASGTERFGAPVAIAAKVAGLGIDNVDGTVSFDPKQHIQRPALLLLNGVVYVAFGSHGDAPPWHGWIMGYSAGDVQKQTAVFNATPNGSGGSLWQSGRGLTADNEGNIYVVTANGDSDEVTEFSDNVLRLNPGDLTVNDWFAPADVQQLNVDDDDLGSSGAVLLPGTNRMITGGKEGVLYLLNTSTLGHISNNNSQIPQSFTAANVGVYNMALWNRSASSVLYMMGGNAPLSAYSLTADAINQKPISQTSSGYAVPFDGITISANGVQPGTGIVWVTTAESWPLPSNGILHAFNADDLTSELWNSSINPDRDFLGSFTKFANPTVANGKVYVPTISNALAVYGLIGASNGGAPTPVITGVVNAASYSNGSLAPGEIVTVFGQNLGPQTLVTGSWNTDGSLGTGVANMQITFNGVPAPILYASSFVMAAIVPYEIAATNQVDVQVSYDGTPSITQTFNVAATAPGIFTDDSSGSGQGAVLNQDFSLNSDANPATRGSIISLYATGGGQTDPPASTGATMQTAAKAMAAVTATVGGQPADVLYAGQAPGEVAGVLQVNLRMPAGVTGDVPVVLTVGSIKTQTTAIVCIQ